jgi:hypothetical protein
MDIAIVNIDTQELLWFQDFLGLSECKAKVDRFLTEHFNQAR